MKTQELIRILNIVLPAVEKKTVIAQHDHFVFMDKNVATYNGKIFFSHPIDLNLNCSVNATDFMEVLKSIDSSDVSLTHEENLLHVKSDDVKAELSTEVYEESVVQSITSMNLAALDWEKAKKVPGEFIDGIDYCLYSVSTDANDIKNLHNIHVADEAIESSDGYRLSEYIMDGSIGDDVLIPGTSAAVLVKFNPRKFIIKNGWMHLLDKEDFVFSLRTGDGTFPEGYKLIDRARKTKMSLELPIELQNALGKFTNLSDGESKLYKFVKIEADGENIKCSTRKDSCKIEKTVPYDGNSKSFSFFINPIFLADMMRKTRKIHINTEMNVALFEIGPFTHVVALPEE